MKSPAIIALVLCSWISGCVVGPQYKRPPVDVPPGYRAESGDQSAPQSLGDEKWWDVFEDPELQQLIRAALARNYDARIAAARVLEAQAELGITRADQFPSADAGANAFTERNPKISSAFPSYEANAGEVNLSMIWNLDFWGRYRRATEAARANLLSTEWGQRAVLSSVVSQLASAYFQLRELDLELDIANRTLASRKDSLKLIKVLADNGSTSLLDVRQAEQLVYTASETVPDLERQIQQQENLISYLLGANPTAVPRGRKITEQPNPPTIPTGLPSQLIERRPDIREAEENLIAANADIGVARASYFPSISLTGTGGFESYALNRLLTGSAGLWNAAASATQPVFRAGSLHAGMKLAEAQQQQMLAAYQQAIKEGFREVSDSLIAYQKNRQFREQQELLTSAAQDADRLSNIRYQNGSASYLEVLTSETNYFAAELGLAQAQLNERLALVQVYTALGGGWQQ